MISLRHYESAVKLVWLDTRRCWVHLSELRPIKVPFPSLSSKFSDSTTSTAIRVLFCLFFHFHTYNSCRFPLKSFEDRHWCNPSLYRKSSNLAWIRSPTEIRIWFYVFHLNTNSLIKGVLIACNPMPSLSLDVDSASIGTVLTNVRAVPSCASATTRGSVSPEGISGESGL